MESKCLVSLTETLKRRVSLRGVGLNESWEEDAQQEGQKEFQQLFLPLLAYFVINMQKENCFELTNSNNPMTKKQLKTQKKKLDIFFKSFLDISTFSEAEKWTLTNMKHVWLDSFNHFMRSYGSTGVREDIMSNFWQAYKVGTHSFAM